MDTAIGPASLRLSLQVLESNDDEYEKFDGVIRAKKANVDSAPQRIQFRFKDTFK
jgi:hypothetical protein